MSHSNLTFLVFIVLFAGLMGWAIMEYGRLDQYKQECDMKNGMVVRTVNGWECVSVQRI